MAAKQADEVVAQRVLTAGWTSQTALVGGGMLKPGLVPDGVAFGNWGRDSASAERVGGRTRTSFIDRGGPLTPASPKAAIDGRRGRGLADRDCLQALQLAAHPLEYPPGKKLAGRVLKALDLVQANVVERVDQRRHDGVDRRIVEHPTELRMSSPPSSTSSS